MLESQHLTLITHGKARLFDISVQAKSGSFIGVLGENGAGKTTLLQCLCGFTRPTSGAVFFNNVAVATFSATQRQTMISYLSSQMPPIWHQTVADILGLSPWPFSPTLMQLFDLESVLSRPMHTLSSGQQQRVLLALKLNHPGPVYLFDEPLAHLDLRYQQRLMRLLKKRSQMGKIILMSLHDPALAMHACSHVWILQHGKLIQAGSPRQILTPTTLQTVFGVSPPLSVLGTPGYTRPSMEAEEQEDP